jgi:hypothetical protein
MQEQSEIIEQSLQVLNQAGILDKIIIAGSWCIYFYQHHYKESKLLSAIRTTDIDINVSPLRRMKSGVNIIKLLTPLGFDVCFHGNGTVTLMHPLIKMEFLIPEIGRGGVDYIDLPHFGINAIPLRFLDIVEKDTITVDYKDLQVRVPHPVRFALHKLIISQRRQTKNSKPKDNELRKTDKDIRQAVEVMEMLARMGEKQKIIEVYDSLTKKQKGYIRDAVGSSQDVIDRVRSTGVNFI